MKVTNPRKQYEELLAITQSGGRLVIFYYTISILILTWKVPTKPVYLQEGESAWGKRIWFTILSLVFGWWGLPWGPIYTIQSIFINLSGGKNISDEMLKSYESLADRVGKEKTEDIESPANSRPTQSAVIQKR